MRPRCYRWMCDLGFPREGFRKMAHILLLDDDPVLRRVITLALEAAGHHVQSFENARKGMQNLAKESADLIISDIVMPEMDGLEMLRRVLQLHPGLPVLAISGGGSFEPGAYLSVAESFGATAILPKPFAARGPRQPRLASGRVTSIARRLPLPQSADYIASFRGPQGRTAAGVRMFVLPLAQHPHD